MVWHAQTSEVLVEGRTNCGLIPGR